MTVQEFFRSKYKGEIPYNGNFLSWYEFAKRAEKVWERKGGYIRYIGSDLDKHGKSFVAFMDEHNTIICVDNDVTVEFQKEEKPIVE